MPELARPPLAERRAARRIEQCRRREGSERKHHARGTRRRAGRPALRHQGAVSRDSGPAIESHAIPDRRRRAAHRDEQRQDADTRRDRTSRRQSRRFACPLQTHGVSIEFLETRPLGNGAWTYCFYLELSGFPHEAPVTEALAEMTQRASTLAVLGAYARSAMCNVPSVSLPEPPTRSARNDSAARPCNAPRQTDLHVT